MIQLKLEPNLVHTWYSHNNIHVIGNAFFEKSLLNSQAINCYFSETKNEFEFKEKLSKLSGHFSIIIELNNTLLLAVDSIRTYPIFIKSEPDLIHISNKIDGTNCSINKGQASFFEHIYCTTDNHTLLNEWQQLQAGEIAIINKTSYHIKIESYYTHCQKENYEINLSQELKKLEQKLIDKIRQYCSNNPILLPLSGGYDSRYLLSLLLKNNIKNITCFTYGRANSYEVKTAEKVCRTLNIELIIIEYSDELLSIFFQEKWKQYSDYNHHFSSLPHEQDFFALHYLSQNNLIPKNAILLNGFCQDLHGGSIFEPIKNIDIRSYILHKHHILYHNTSYENTWNGYQEWFIKNRVSKFIINSVRVYEFFGIDFYLPFWQKDWIEFWYTVPLKKRLNQSFYNNYLMDGIFKEMNIDFIKPSYDSTNKHYRIKTLAKKVLPRTIKKYLQDKNSIDINKDTNNTLFLYKEIYKRLIHPPNEKNFRINNIHALYLLQTLKQEYSL